MKGRKPGAFRSLPHARARGQAAEEAAIAFLERSGLELIARNVRTAAGEIDVIVRDRDTLCFVEVKARSRSEYGGAVAAVTREKQRRLARAANLYLARRQDRPACRFDVLAMDLQPGGTWEIVHLKSAFEVPWP